MWLQSFTHGLYACALVQTAYNGCEILIQLDASIGNYYVDCEHIFTGAVIAVLYQSRLSTTLVSLSDQMHSLRALVPRL